MTRQRIGLTVAALIAAAALVVVGVFGYRYTEDRAADRTRADVVGAASQQVEAMFSYTHATVDSELPKSADGLTGEFRGDYEKLIKEVIAPGAKEKQLTVKATTTAAGVVSATPDTAVVLVFLNQVSTGKDVAEGTTTGSRVRVTLQKEDGRWLVSQVTPV